MTSTQRRPLTSAVLAANVARSRRKAARRMARLASTARAVRTAFNAMSPAEQREGRAMLRRVAAKAQHRQGMMS